MTMHEQAGSVRGWTPVRFFLHDGQPTVEWCQLGDLRLTGPFFEQSVAGARAGGCAACLTPADVLAEFASDTPDLPLAGIIFHLSRCGSTLVSRMLAALPENVVLSEPEFPATLLHAQGWPALAGPGERIRFLRAWVHAQGVRRFPEERRLFIKLEPWLMLDFDLIRAAFPGVPWVFIYRDPVEIMVSQSDNIAAMLMPDPAGAARIGLPFIEALSMTHEEYCARVLGRIAEAAIAAALADPAAGRLVSYPQLPGAVETVIAPWFGLALDETATGVMRQTARFYAKAPGKIVFQEDSAGKQRTADKELRELADRWIGPAHARLEELHSSRPAVLKNVPSERLPN
jgi:hypothetical protein